MNGQHHIYNISGNNTSKEQARPKIIGKFLDAWSIIAVLIFFLAALPILALGWQAMGNSTGVWPHLIENVLPHSSLATLFLMLGVGLLVLIVGSTTAWLVSRYSFPFSGVLQWALVLPIAIPTYIAAYCWTEFFDFTGPIQEWVREIGGYENSRQYWFPDIRSMGGAIFIMSIVLFPYVYLPARLSFQMQGSGILESARVLGAGPLKLFWKIALPTARPALAVGVMLALMETLNDIGAVEHLGVRTLTYSIFDTWLNRSSLAGAAQISLILLMVILLMVLLERQMRSQQSYYDHKNPPRPHQKTRLVGIKAFAASCWCLLPILLGFGIPVLQLLQFTVSELDENLSPELFQAIYNSLSVSIFAALICIICGFFLVYAQRRSLHNIFGWVSRLSSLGYAIPGTILAIGILTALTGVDHSISDWMEQLTGERSGLLISGSIAIVIYACAVRFLAIAIGNIDAGYSKISTNMTAAARTLGRTETRALWEIELPLLKRALGTAGLFVMVESMKELSATLLLRPFNFNTLATFIYESASRAVFEEVALASLLIVLIGLVPVYLLTHVVILEQK